MALALYLTVDCSYQGSLPFLPGGVQQLLHFTSCYCLILIIFQKRYLEIQRAWSEIEASKKDLRIQKEHFDVAKSNFAL